MFGVTDPFYQRAYVWAKEEQWEPLWNHVVRARLLRDRDAVVAQEQAEVHHIADFARIDVSLAGISIVRI